ncbi:MAG TPA: hypothetical protein DD001_18130 [Microcoleaceae bacterium UBA10368]|nr:hypothetical protein [Microcoleaceae cyanobacterium UBA10368]
MAEGVISAAARGVGRSIANMAERAFNAQEEDEFVEIDSDGVVRPLQPNPKGVALRDVKGEY